MLLKMVTLKTTLCRFHQCFRTFSVDGKGKGGGESNKLYPSIQVIRSEDRVDSTTRDYLPQRGYSRMSTLRLWGSAEQSFSGTLLALLSASFHSWAVSVH